MVERETGRGALHVRVIDRDGGANASTSETLLINAADAAKAAKRVCLENMVSNFFIFFT